MKRRSILALGTTALLVAALMPTTAIAQSPSRFEHLNVRGLKPKALPMTVNPNRQVTVMLQLAGKPVTVRQGERLESQNRQLTASEKGSARSQLVLAQNAVKRGVQAAGGRVLATYQYAYNGIRIRVAQGQLAKLARLPEVIAVRKLQKFKPDNTTGVRYIGAPSAWQDYGLTGTNIRIGIIDTGIDYTHANFGGPGTRAAYEANNPRIVEPGTFPTAKVVGGYDFAGDNYNASADDDPTTPDGTIVPSPDRDPLDCEGHGSHVAGTAAGFGVLAGSGATYRGDYNLSTYTGRTFRIGPGVAPNAKLYAYKVFGCEGSTDLTVDAIELAVRDGVNVINMSLGSPFGRSDDPTAVASDNAAYSGVTVVASAGNSGPSGYITGSPATGDRVISVAAMDAIPDFPSAVISGAKISPAIRAINANDGPLPVSGTLKVLRDASGGIALGCTAAEYAGSAGKIVVVRRGTCARTDRPKLGQAAGAKAVIMVNNADSYPPYEGGIAGVRIPFLGVKSSAAPALIAADGSTVTITAAPRLANPDYRKVTPFSSGGPRNWDSAPKPDVAAPGSSVLSTLAGSGNLGTRMSGTSMASPFVAGVAALVKQARPSWSPTRIKAAIVGTAAVSSSTLIKYEPRTAGAGLVQPRRAVDTATFVVTGPGSASLAYGYEQLASAYSKTEQMRLYNDSSSAVTYRFATTFAGASYGANATVTPGTVTIPAGSSTVVSVNMSLSAAAVAALPSASQLVGAYAPVVTIRGVVNAIPVTSRAGVYSLRVPFLLVPRGLSSIQPSQKSPYTSSGNVRTTSVKLQNYGIHSGTADVYNWQLSDGNELMQTMDVRAVGVQSFAGDFGNGAADQFMVFAINTWGRWSNAIVNEFDIAIDTDRDGTTDYYVIGIDAGYVTTGSFDGRLAAFTFDADFNIVDAYLAEAPMNGSTVLLPTLAHDIGLKGSARASTGDFSYEVATFSLESIDQFDSVSGTAVYNPYAPVVSQGNFITLAPGTSTRLGLQVHKDRLAATPSKGWLVVTMDDPNGAAQADTIPLGRLP